MKKTVVLLTLVYIKVENNKLTNHMVNKRECGFRPDEHVNRGVKIYARLHLEIHNAMAYAYVHNDQLR